MNMMGITSSHQQGLTGNRVRDKVGLYLSIRCNKDSRYGYIIAFIGQIAEQQLDFGSEDVDFQAQTMSYGSNQVNIKAIDLLRFIVNKLHGRIRGIASNR